ncbi:MAG: hypothetical protein WA364_07735 [Candidatus Nitrosopolaris sp.]
MIYVKSSQRYVILYSVSMVSTTYNKTVKVGIVLPKSLIKQTNKLRGDVKRSTYIRRAVEYYLKEGEIE